MHLRDFLIERGVWIDGFCWSSYSQLPGTFSDSEYSSDRHEIVLYVHEKYGRFGNNFLQVVHSLIVARRLSITNIQFKFYIDENKTNTMFIDNIKLSFGVEQPSNALNLCGTMFYLQGFEKFIASLNYSEVKSDCERLYRIIFGAETHQRTDWKRKKVVFHFRSGDIFEKFASPIYTQPPYSYYKKALEHIHDTTRDLDIYIVYENEKNPCIMELQKHLVKMKLPFKNQSSTLTKDARLIASADYIVASYSSFCDVLALMNENLERWYSFRSVGAYEDIDLSICSCLSKILQENGTKVFKIDDDKKQYTPLGEWEFAPKQIDQLLNYPISNLSIKLIEN